jgi:hypothetical protein
VRSDAIDVLDWACALVLLLIGATFASAQPVQVGPSVAVTFHAGMNWTCQGIELEQWPLVYGQRCHADPPVVLVPYISHVLVRLTPMTMPPTPPAVDPDRPVVIRSVPRTSVWRTLEATTCAPTPAPCLSVRVPSLSGLQLVEVALQFADGQQSEWVPLGQAIEGRVQAVAPSEGRIRP